MLPGEVKGDAAFTAFQVELATVVTNARARGLSISRRFDPGCCCPLGAHPESDGSHPPSICAAKVWTGVSQFQLSAFIRGFSGDDIPLASPFFDLGCAYREAFP